MVNSLIIIACALSLVSAVDEPRDDSSALSTMTLPADNAGTASIGHPYTGKLRDGVRLPPSGPYHVAQRSTQYRNWLFGTGYLVRGIMLAAKSVAEELPSGEPLVVGNLSRKSGGNIKLSVSHNSGRDVDFAFYTADLQGRSVASEYHHFGDDGLSLDAPKKYKLDIPRNWQLLKSFIQSTEVEVQWIIVSPGIEKLLLQYAASQGESKELIERAEKMTMLPDYAKPHDNHIHLRVQCSPQDWENNCKIGGPVWPWNKRLHTALSEATQKILPKLRSEKLSEQKQALKLIRKKHLNVALKQVAELLTDKNLSIQREALLTILELSNEGNATEVLNIARTTPSRISSRLLTHSILLAGASGVETAKELLNGTHPVIGKAKWLERNRKLMRRARRILRKYN